ncbi:MAG: flagellar motor switch protein FliM, partial [Janthinobacterium lividum]
MTDNFLSQEEVDTLLKGVNGEQENSAAANAAIARPYNLAAPDRAVQGRMPVLDTINERFVRKFRTGLSTFLRRNAEITLGELKIIKCSEFLEAQAVPTSLNIIQLKPLRGQAIIAIEPNLVFLMVDNLFGGAGRMMARPEGREFSQAEQRIVRRVIDVIFESYKHAWETVYPLDFEFVRAETNVRFVHVAEPEDMVVSMPFSVTLGEVSGEMQICIPYLMFEPIRDLLANSKQEAPPEVDKTWSRRMRLQLQSAEVELIANLGTASSTLGAILNMKPGDVLPLTLEDLVQARVDGIPVMECSYGKLNGQYALRVEKLLP